MEGYPQQYVKYDGSFRVFPPEPASGCENKLATGIFSGYQFFGKSFFGKSANKFDMKIGKS